MSDIIDGVPSNYWFLEEKRSIPNRPTSAAVGIHVNFGYQILSDFIFKYVGMLVFIFQVPCGLL
jgi:hypothetical protein